MKHLKKQYVQHSMTPARGAERRAWMEQVRRDMAAFDWHMRDTDAVETLHPDRWRVWLRNGPCKGCPCEPWCDVPCSLRLRWWDDVLAQLRRRWEV